MKKLFIGQTVYGQEYTDIFLKYHLKSMLDPTNIPAHKERVEYGIYTDKEMIPIIQSDPGVQELSKIVHTRIFEFTWPQGANKKEERYRALLGTFRMQLQHAMSHEMNMSYNVADNFVAKGFLTKMFEKLDAGHDAVISLAMRSTLETISLELDKYPHSCSPMELFGLAYQHMHPIWTANHFESQQFSKMPFTMLWNSGRGLLARSFAVTPMAFVPDQRLSSVGHVLDADLPSLFKNPYIATDWTDSPIIGIEPIKAFFPPFRNGGPNVEWINSWCKRALHQSQPEWLKTSFYFPNYEKSGFFDLDLLKLEIDKLCSEIIS